MRLGFHNLSNNGLFTDTYMVNDQTIQDLCNHIVQEFHPDRIILFGSYASGNPTPDSDVDLLVLLPFAGKNLRKSLEILTRTNPRFPSICWPGGRMTPSAATGKATR